MKLQLLNKISFFNSLKTEKIYFLILLIFSLVILISCSESGKVKDEQQGETDSINAERLKKDSIDFANANGRLTPEILWKFGRLSDIQISPDRQTILYGVKYYDLLTNKGNTDLYTLSIDGGTPVKVTDFEGSEFNGLWRPDGKKIGFLSAENGSVQLWEMNPDGTDKKEITSIEDGIESFSYSPDMSQILFIKSIKLDESANEIHSDLPLANTRIIDDLMYRHWSSWHDFTYNHILIASYKDGSIGKEKDIMEDEKYNSPMKPWGGMEQIAWSNDGKNIAYTCQKLIGREYTVSTNSEIYLYNLESEKTVNLSQPNEGYDKNGVFSPDGEMMVWESMKTPGFESDKSRILVHTFKSGETIDLSEGFDQNSSHFVWSNDGKMIYFISGIKATYQIFSINTETKEIRQITKGTHNYTSFQLAGNTIIGTKMSMSLPTEIFKIDIKTGTEEQLSFTNKNIFDKITFGNVEERWIKTTDNKDMLTWVIYPPEFDSTKKYPALLYCQGGPQSAVSQFFSYRWNFQMMAAHDYIIVAPNRRGLPTFGQEWNDQISGDYGGQNIKDYLSAIDEMAKEPYIDEGRLGAVGASYGGYSVLWLAGHHEKRFKVFISHCGIFNFESMYTSTEEAWFVNYDFEGPYWQKPKPKSYEFSPHLYVDKWDAPIMIITGANDFRIPYTESLQAFNAAQLRGVPSRLLFFPEESHFVLKPQNAVLWQREFFKWLDEWLK